jgi:hypothetical protein
MTNINSTNISVHVKSEAEFEFSTLPSGAITIEIGFLKSRVTYFFDTPDEARDFVYRMATGYFDFCTNSERNEGWARHYEETVGV